MNSQRVITTKYLSISRLARPIHNTLRFNHPRPSTTIASRPVQCALRSARSAGGCSPAAEGKAPFVAAIPFMSSMFMKARMAGFGCDHARRS